MPHPRDPALEEQVDDELELVEDLEIRHLRRVAALDEGFECRSDQRVDASAQDHLFAEEVGLGFVAEGGFDDAGAGSTDAVGVRQAERLRLTGGVLVDGQERGDTAAIGVLAPDQVAGPFRGDHHHVDFGRW